MSRVVIYECCLGDEHPAFSLLKDEGFDLVACPDGETLLEEVVQHRPDVLIYALKPDSPQDLAVLQLLRRAAPELPLVLLASEGSLSTQRLVQDLRPIYYAVCPIEASELRDAVRAALSRTGRGPAENHRGSSAGGQVGGSTPPRR